MKLLPDSEIDERLGSLGSGWRRERDALVCERECEDFAAAIALVNRIAEAAELADHHPDLLLHSYRRLRITLTTHSAGGITGADFALAATIDAL